MKFRLLISLLGILAFVPISFSNDVPTQSISEQDLEKGTVNLSGLWAFDWQELHIDPNRPMQDGILLPGLWHKQGPYEHFGYGTFRLNVQLPKTDRHYLRVPDAPSALVLWINGEQIYRRGTVGHDKTSESPKFGPQVIQLPAKDRYEIVIHISNYHHKDGGMWHNLVLSSEQHYSKLQDQSKLLDAMMFVFLLLVSTYLLLTAWGRQRRSASIFFASFVWVIALRSVFVGERIAYDFFGDFSWTVQQRIEHIFLLMALPLFAYYFHRFFRMKELWFAHGMAVITGGLSIVTLFSPASLFTYFGWAAQALGVISVLYFLVGLAFLIRQEVPQSRLFLWSFIGWSALVVHDFFYTHLLIQSRPLAQFGLIFFVIMQSYMLWLQRNSESRLLSYIKTAVDQKTQVLKEVFLTYEKQQAYIHQEILPVLTQSQSMISSKQDEYAALQSIIDNLKGLKPKSSEYKLVELDGLALGLKPYFYGLSCDLKTPSLQGYVYTNEDWLQHMVLLLARLGEIHGLKSQVKIFIEDDQCIVRYRIFSKDKYEVSDLPELNLIERILTELNAHINYRFDSRFSQFWFALPISDSIPIEEKEDLVIGNSQGMPILLSVARKEIFVQSLSPHYQVILNSLSIQNIKKFRPKLVVVQYNPDDHYQLDNLAEIKQQFPNLGVVLVIDSYHKSQLVQFIRKGISDYLVEPVLDEELQLRVQTALRYSELDSNSVEPIDIREVTVQLIRTCIQFWQSYTGKSKADLAERSRLWRVYMDGSTAKTRTLDKYLSLQSLPKNPRWDTVGRTASFVLEECPLNEKDKREISTQLKQFNQLLSV